MKIVITGNLGFIGIHLSAILIERGHTVIGFDKEQASGNEKYKCIQGNILDVEFLKKSLNDDIDLIIHLTAVHKDNIHPSSLYKDVNVTGTQNIIDACKINNINKIIFTSTVAIYGLDLIQTNEDSTPSPFNDYGHSKLIAENKLIDWCNSNENRSLVIIRPSVVFGEGNRGNMYNLIKQINDNKFIMIGGGKNKKSIAYVGNLAKFIKLTLNCDKGVAIYNYADKPDLSMNELVAMIYRILRKNEKKFYLPYWIGMIFGNTCDILSFVIRKNIRISSIRIKKFCSNSIISTEKLESLDYKRSLSLYDALKKTIQYEFID